MTDVKRGQLHEPGAGNLRLKRHRKGDIWGHIIDIYIYMCVHISALLTHIYNKLIINK